MGRSFAVAAVCTCAALLSPACGKRGAKHIERAEDAGAGVVIVKRTSDGVRLVAETEPNDEIGAAMALEVPGGVNGTLAGATDVDRYKLHIERPGPLYVEVGGIEGVDLVAEITDGEGVVLAHCDNGPGMVSEGFPNYPVEAGDYWVVVREFTAKKKKPREGASPPYQLTVKSAPEPLDSQELEPNSKPELARPVVVGGEVRGYVGWRRDVDSWSIPLEGLGENDGLDIDVDAVAGVELDIGMTRGKQVLLRRRGARGQALAVRGWMPAADSEAPVFLTVSGKRSSFDEPYVIRVVARAVGFDEEAEPNDALATAATLAVAPGASSGARRGHLTPGDVDVYAVPVAGGRQELSVTVEPGAPSLDVALAIVSADGEPVAEADAAGKGHIEKLDGAGIIANAKVFLRVTRKPSKDAANDDTVAAYSLRWSLTGGAVIPSEMFE
jgi:hypothetical protein